MSLPDGFERYRLITNSEKTALLGSPIPAMALSAGGYTLLHSPVQLQAQLRESAGGKYPAVDLSTGNNGFNINTMGEVMIVGIGPGMLAIAAVVATQRFRRYRRDLRHAYGLQKAWAAELAKYEVLEKEPY